MFFIYYSYCCFQWSSSLESPRRSRKLHRSCLNRGSYAYFVWNRSFVQDHEPQNTEEYPCD